MPAAGWYDDPAGTPRTYRYWDGSAWSRETTADPTDPAPGSASRPAPGQPAPPPGATVLPPAQARPETPAAPQPQTPQPPQPEPEPAAAPAPVPAGGGTGWSAYDGAPGGGFDGTGNRSVWVTVAIVAVAVLVVAGIGVGAFVVSGRIGGDSSSDEGSTAAEEGSDEPSETRPTEDLDCNSGNPEPEDPQTGVKRVVGGGISMPRVPGYTIDVAQAEPFEFATSFTPQVKVIEKDPTGGWVSVYGVSGLDTGYGSPEDAAETVMACMADSSTLYSDFTERKDLENDEFEVEGAETAWLLKSELHVDNPDLEVTGDLAYVVVVDTGDDEEYGLYISVVPLGAKKLAGQQQKVSGQLKVE